MLATPSAAMREYARNVGAESTECMWINTPYDTWVRNPFYNGPEQPHPEEFQEEEQDSEPLPDNWNWLNETPL